MEDIDDRDEAGEVDTGVGEDESTPESTSEDEPAVLAKRFADTQKAYHEGQKELKELREKQAKMEGMMEVLTKGDTRPVEQPDPFAEVDEDAYWTDFYDDPQKLRKLTQKQIQVFGQTILADRRKTEALEKVLTEVRGELKELRAGANKPDQAMSQKIQKLREDPDLADLPDDVLAKFAKKLPDAPGYPGGPPTSGGRVRAKAGKDGMTFSSPDVRKKYEQMRKDAGFGG